MRHIPLLVLCLLLQACTQTQKGLEDTVIYAFNGPDDVTVTDQQVESLPYASMYLRVNNGQRIFVVLGYNEQGQQKWVTQDKAMLITEHGRLVKTLGLSDNLIDINNLQNDPLRDALHISDGSSWTRTLSWTEKGQLRAATAVSHFSRGTDEVLHLAGEAVPCRLWLENVTVDALGKSWQNRFWIDNTSGQVLQTEQQLGADYLPVATTILKPAQS